MISKIAIAIDTVFLDDRMEHKDILKTADYTRDTITPDNLYRIYLWEDIDITDKNMEALLSDIKKIRHAVISISEEGVITSDFQDSDDWGVDEEFNEILNWDAYVTLWGDTEDPLLPTDNESILSPSWEGGILDDLVTPVIDDFLSVFKKNIQIDFSKEIRYASDQADICYPVRFATVTFQLIPNNFLNHLADVNRGKQGTYTFLYGINDFLLRKTDSVINYIVMDTDDEDEGEIYAIDLSEKEQEIIWESLDKQCKEKKGMGCDTLLAEAKKAIE